MRKYGLVSVYTKRKFRAQKSSVNNANTENVLDRKFKDKRELEVLVSDLTYVDVLGNWNYVCFVLDLFNREIVGHAVGEHKSAELVQEALSTIPYDCSKIEIFHTDRGKEFDNTQIEEFLSAFDIQRSLSHKGTPHDNAVAESTYKAFKAEFVYQECFETLEELKVKTFDFVHWWNNIRLHSTLNYKTPAQVREKHV
jgi:putative transposase